MVILLVGQVERQSPEYTEEGLKSERETTPARL